MLEKENEELRAELSELAELRVRAEEVDRLRAEVDELRARVRGENEDAFMKRTTEERDELQREVRDLRDRLATQEGELARLRRAANQRGNRDPLGELASAITDLLRGGKR
ncbi:MAG: hypothetical protein JST00_22885 [Deltaproteobacteria bacterium]|nr:hypothetical protein [Deltaproteobacteria bacterium]